jgi:putative hydrolase of the HAD superfamily
MVKDGIEELLERNDLLDYFKFVVTSVKEGWRKPCPLIYSTAVQKAGVKMENIIFIGDDYINDYLGPKNFGLKAVLLDRYNKYPQLTERVQDFYSLEYYIG